MLRPLPFPHGDQLVRISQHDARNRDANTFVAAVRLEDWNRMNSTFSAVTGYYTDDLSEISGPLPEKLTMALVAPRFLEVLDVAPTLGRNFAPEEEHFGGPNAVIISYHLWQRRFAGDPAILTRKLHIGRFFLLHRRRHARVVRLSRRATSNSGRQARPMRPSPSAATQPGSPSSAA